MADQLSRPRRRAALVGVGPISTWHVRALRMAGIDVTAVAARPGSIRLRAFAYEHGIPRTFERWQDLLHEHGAWDGVVIATHTDATPEVLAVALAERVPVLVEKPVAWTSAVVARLRETAHPRVLVGFNRRYYRPVRFLHEACRKSPPVLGHLELPESVPFPTVDATPDRLAPFFSNSCHGFDLLRFVFGALRLVHVRQLRSQDATYAIAGLVESARGDLITVTCNWGAPANFALTIDMPGRRLELRPFERATVYEGMDVIEPSDDVPVRRYVPRTVERIELDPIDAR